jgi:excisionase family DNA binding protein
MSSEIFLNGITINQLAEALVPILNLQKAGQSQFQNNLLTPDEACKYLSCKRTSLWKHTKSGKLKSYGLGNRVYYKLEEILEAVKPINH